MSNRALILFAPIAAAVLLGGCTAGIVVDESFNPIPIGDFVTMTFVGVDSTTGQRNGENHTYYFAAGPKSYAVSFDPYADESDGSGGAPVNDVANAKQFIPDGSYFIILNEALFAPVTLEAVSQIFTHHYGESCTDYFNGGTDRCAQYYFQIVKSKTPSCTGVGCFGPPLASNGGIPVIPLYQLPEQPSFP